MDMWGISNLYSSIIFLLLIFNSDILSIILFTLARLANFNLGLNKNKSICSVLIILQHYLFFCMMI